MSANCRNCGEPLTPGNKFCLNCGESVDLICPKCGKALPDEARFCLSCGAAVDQGGREDPSPIDGDSSVSDPDFEGTISLVRKNNPSVNRAEERSARQNTVDPDAASNDPFRESKKNADPGRSLLFLALGVIAVLIVVLILICANGGKKEESEKNIIPSPLPPKPKRKSPIPSSPCPPAAGMTNRKRRPRFPGMTRALPIPR